LQHLPDHALLLVTTRSSGLELTPVECDPAIITLPRVSTKPLPEPAVTPLPGPGYPQQAPGSAATSRRRLARTATSYVDRGGYLASVRSR
jgi:hypothetical protein